MCTIFLVSISISFYCLRKRFKKISANQLLIVLYLLNCFQGKITSLLMYAKVTKTIKFIIIVLNILQFS